MGRLIVSDPDPEIRTMAVRALGRATGEVPFRVVEQGLRDPDDSVRAAMVHVAAERCPTAAPLVARLAVRRRWPMSQLAALERLPELIDAVPGLAEENLETLLSGVATMEPPPLESERPALSEIARSVGVDRLAEELHRLGPRRLGAVRLLLMEGSPPSLRRVASLADDPVEEVRLSAAAAANMLGPGEVLEPAGADQPSQPGGADAPGPTDDDILAALAAALEDPDEEVRNRCREALRDIPQAAVFEWVDRALTGPDAKSAARAAAMAEALHLHAAAAALLGRASSLPPEARGPFVGALEALRLAPKDLGRLVQGADPVHRQEAVRLAWQVGGRYMLPLVRSLVEDPTAAVRIAALEVLAEAADPSAVPLSSGRLDEDSSARVRATAVRLLARAGGAQRFQALQRALADADPDVRSTAVDALPPQLSGEASDILVRALEDDDERVWRAALPHVMSLPEGDVPLVWEAFRRSAPAKREEIARALERAGGGRLASLAATNAAAADWADRALAVDLAARAGTESGIGLVVEALEDPDPVVRRAAATALATVRTTRAVPALARTLSDPQADVRVEAVRALGLVDDDAVLPHLISALKDPTVMVREMASEALGRWRSPGVARRLAGALGSPELRRPAEALLQAMGQTAIEPLVDLIVEGDRVSAAVAGGLLERISGPEPFVRRLASRRPDERLRAVEVLGAIDGPSASEWLMGSLADPDQAVRARAVSLLGQLGDPRAVEPLKQVFLTDPVAQVSAAAEEALRRLGSMPAETERPSIEMPDLSGERSEGHQPPTEG